MKKDKTNCLLSSYLFYIIVKRLFSFYNVFLFTLKNNRVVRKVGRGSIKRTKICTIYEKVPWTMDDHTVDPQWISD